jgi:hypothetical protein
MWFIKNVHLIELILRNSNKILILIFGIIKYTYHA